MAEYEAMPPSYASLAGDEPVPDEISTSPTRSPPGQPRSWKTMLKANYQYLIIVLTPILLSPIAIAQPNPVSSVQ